jgi:hypothetical protein
MRYPPALQYTLAASVIYRCVACFFAIILIANYIYLAGGKGVFYSYNWAWMLLTACVVVFLQWDAWRSPRGQLQFSQGQWVWQQAGQEIQGTLRLHLDLQAYMLVSFVQSAPALVPTASFIPIKTQWFHLEARHTAPAVSPTGWLALRRAVHAQAVPTHEERVA